MGRTLNMDAMHKQGRMMQIVGIAIICASFANNVLANTNQDSKSNVEVVYEELQLAGNWADYSWDKHYVDTLSNPGMNSSTALDVKIGPWGAFALAHLEQDSRKCQSCNKVTKPFHTSDQKVSEMVLKIQGPLGSTRKLDTKDLKEDDKKNWIYLTDGRVIPKIQSLTTRDRVPDFIQPAHLKEISFYLEDSKKGQSTKEYLISDLLGIDNKLNMQNTIDDSSWLTLSIALSPLLQESSMTKWDKVVLKDVSGKGFHIRMDDMHLTPSLQGGKQPTEAAVVYQSNRTGKAIHTWLAERQGLQIHQKDVNETALEEEVRKNTLQSVTEQLHCHSYDSPIEIAHISDSELKEPSGFTSSRRFPGILWTHQDRGTKPYIYAIIAETGEVVSKLHVETKEYRETDWEDMSSALCPDGSGDHCLWIADSGNVARDREEFFVHVFREPGLERWGKVRSHDIWTFVYRLPFNDVGKRPWIDIESLVVPPDGSKFYLIEKTVNGQGNGPVTIWETPKGKGPKDVLAKDKDNILIDISKRGRDSVRDHPDFILELELANKINNPNIWPITHFLKPEAFDPPLPKWKEDKFKSGQNWNKLRAITGVDLHPSGKTMIACTYSGIWEYPLLSPYDLKHIGEPRLLSLTSRFDDPFWQTEAIAYDSKGDGIWLTAEYFKGHQPLRYFGCSA